MRHAFCLLLVAWLGWCTPLQAATIDSAQLVQAARSQVGVTLAMTRCIADSTTRAAMCRSPPACAPTC